MAKAASNTREAVLAAFVQGQILVSMDQYEAAVACLEAALQGHWEEPWADRFYVFRLVWLADGGEYDRAIQLFDDFVRWHASSGGARMVVKAVWLAYQMAQRADEGRQRLDALLETHSDDAVGRAIRELMRVPPPPP